MLLFRNISKAHSILSKGNWSKISCCSYCSRIVLQSWTSAQPAHRWPRWSISVSLSLLLLFVLRMIPAKGCSLPARYLMNIYLLYIVYKSGSILSFQMHFWNLASAKPGPSKCEIKWIELVSLVFLQIYIFFIFCALYSNATQCITLWEVNFFCIFIQFCQHVSSIYFVQ